MHIQNSFPLCLFLNISAQLLLWTVAKPQAWQFNSFAAWEGQSEMSKILEGEVRNEKEQKHIEI